MTVFISALRATVAEKDRILLAASRGEGPSITIDAERFRSLPGSPFSYWCPTEVHRLFKLFEPAESGARRFTKGLCTTDDKRFVRLWWESNLKHEDKWRSFVNGGNSVSFYADSFLNLNWSRNGDELKAYLDHKIGAPGQWSRWINSVDYYFRPGFTWPLRASKFSPQVLPAGHIFSVRSYVGFEDQEKLGSLVALTSSRVFDYIFKTCLGRSGYPEFVVGVVQKLPIPPIPEDARDELDTLFRQAWSQGLRVAQSEERSTRFVLPNRVRANGGATPGARDMEVARIQREIDKVAFDLYGLDQGVRDQINDWLGAAQTAIISGTLAATDDDVNIEGGDEQDEDGDEDEVEFNDTSALLSWSVGVAFARFDIRYATGERAIPPEPDPFDPLPALSPGMLPDVDAAFMPTSGVFVDDPGHADDLAARVTAVYDRVGETPPAPDALRRTLAKDFFPAHIRMYSKSRRKAPIYWQLATPTASYSVWLYIHAFGKDTLFRVQNEYVAPKLAHERRELEGLLADAGPTPTTAQSRAIEAQTNFVEELSALLDEVKRVAPLWDPDLDDGVILNFAPLWRLVPKNRAWQNELRAAWASLVDGDYDWARLSMRLWPERVVPKCAKDRSLAIAHDLEDVFWFEDAAGKWQARPTPTRPLDDLIADRTSTAVKAALLSLLDAPDPVAASGRGRRKKS